MLTGREHISDPLAFEELETRKKQVRRLSTFWLESTKMYFEAKDFMEIIDWSSREVTLALNDMRAEIWKVGWMNEREFPGQIFHFMHKLQKE